MSRTNERPHGVDDGACKQCYGEATRGEQGAALSNDARECLMDVVSHYDNIVAGFAAQRLNACEAGDSDNATYWTREMNVANRMKVQAERALAASAPTLSEADLTYKPPTWTVSEWNVGKWLSAALEDENVCDEMKRDVRAWFDELNACFAQPQAAEPKGEPAAWINYPCKIENNEFAGHGEPELTFKRQAYGYDLDKAEPLYRAAEPKGLTALLRANHLRRCDALSDVGFEIETEAGAVVVLTLDRLRALLSKGE